MRYFLCIAEIPRGAANTTAHQEEPSQEGIQLNLEKKAAIIGAMKNVKLEYVPPWATRISEADFSTQVGVLAAARRQSEADQPIS